jgi:hypothetical protein
LDGLNDGGTISDSSPISAREPVYSAAVTISASHPVPAASHTNDTLTDGPIPAATDLKPFLAGQPVITNAHAQKEQTTLRIPVDQALFEILKSMSTVASYVYIGTPEEIKAYQDPNAKSDKPRATIETTIIPTYTAPVRTEVLGGPGMAGVAELNDLDTTSNSEDEDWIDHSGIGDCSNGCS